MIEIKRKDATGELKDILYHMKKLDLVNLSVTFCMPWDFSRITIESDSDNIEAVAAAVNYKLTNERIDGLEKKMNDNHSSVMNAIRELRTTSQSVNTERPLIEAQRLAAATWPELSLGTRPGVSAVPESVATPGSKRLRNEDGVSVERQPRVAGRSMAETVAGGIGQQLGLSLIHI